MFIPQLYSVALAMMVGSLLCWGCWANTQKAAKNWRLGASSWGRNFTARVHLRGDPWR